MTIQEIQNNVMQFVKEHQLETSLETRMLDLTSEIGELSKEVLKGTGYGKRELCLTAKWEEEFGDVLFSLICIANNTGINMENSINNVLNKYKNRFITKGNISSDI